jgi:hypothetical protein
MFSVSEITEFVMQTGHIIELYNIEFKEDIPPGEEHVEEVKEAAEGEAEGGEDAAKEAEAKKPKYPMKPIIKPLYTFNVGKKDAQGVTTNKSMIKGKISDGVKIDLASKRESSDDKKDDKKKKDVKKEKFFLLLND